MKYFIIKPSRGNHDSSAIYKTNGSGYALVKVIIPSVFRYWPKHISGLNDTCVITAITKEEAFLELV